MIVKLDGLMGLPTPLMTLSSDLFFGAPAVNARSLARSRSCSLSLSLSLSLSPPPSLTHHMRLANFNPALLVPLGPEILSILGVGV